jgi:hypothetical protein
MAIITFHNTKEQTVASQTAAAVWQTLTGELENPTQKQTDFVITVERVWLNWRNPLTPDSYIEANKEIIFPIALGSWMVDRQGQATRPEPGDDFGREFGKKWGLLKGGFITPLGRQYAK